MFIQTESTPNPQTLKFIPGVEVMPTGTATFTDVAQATSSPLARVLLQIPEVTGIFLGSNFISVTKDSDASWDTLKPEVLTTIMEHFVAGKAVIEHAQEKATDDSNAADETPLMKQIRELIDTRVRPAVAQDGGDIIFRGFDEATGIVQLEMHGACAGCPSSTVTLQHGIENMLKHYVPEVTGVEAVEE